MPEMKWFGRAHGVAHEIDSESVPTPVGAQCVRCDERIGFHDDGVLVPSLDVNFTHYAFHFECFQRGLVGGINHQLGRCFCCGGSDPPDPPDMTRREAARLAVEHWTTTRRRLRA